MVSRQVHNSTSGTIYSSGDILACFLGIVYGVFSLGIAAPNFKAIAEGRVAGKLAFDIIERKPLIPLDDAQADKHEKLEGKIEFKNVTFTYPSRPW